MPSSLTESAIFPSDSSAEASMKRLLTLSGSRSRMARSSFTRASLPPVTLIRVVVMPHALQYGESYLVDDSGIHIPQGMLVPGCNKSHWVTCCKAHPSRGTGLLLRVPAMPLPSDAGHGQNSAAPPS